MKELIEKLKQSMKYKLDDNQNCIIDTCLIKQAIKALSQSEWISVEDRLPICLESGNWDGLRSSQILCKDKDGTCYVGLVYEGIMDGSKFVDWYDSKGWELKDIVQWKNI